jgi:hypothetical protein
LLELPIVVIDKTDAAGELFCAFPHMLFLKVDSVKSSSILYDIV